MSPEVAAAHNQRAFLICAMTVIFAASVGWLVGGQNGTAWALAGTSLALCIFQLLA